MMIARIAFVAFVAAIAITYAIHHRPAAKIQDRLEPVEAFCANYYSWREAQLGGGISAADLICFNAATMRP